MVARCSCSGDESRNPGSGASIAYWPQPSSLRYGYSRREMERHPRGGPQRHLWFRTARLFRRRHTMDGKHVMGATGTGHRAMCRCRAGSAPSIQAASTPRRISRANWLACPRRRRAPVHVIGSPTVQDRMAWSAPECLPDAAAAWLPNHNRC
jgi:hypothetical protein